MEPEDGLHVASVIVDAVFQRFLEHTVHIVTLKNFTLIGSLDRRLVEKVHYSKLIIINQYMTI